MQELDPQSLYAWANKSDPPLLLDVREPWEVETASINKGAAALELLAIPMGQIPRRLNEIDPERQIVCMCHHGVRSMQVALFLEHQGFKSVWNLTGGIERWARTVDNSVPRY